MTPQQPPASTPSVASDSTSAVVPDSSSPPGPPDAGSSDRALTRLDSRLARLEAQVRALDERLGEVQGTERSRKQRALWIRLVLLLVLVGLFFVLQATGGFG